jgi:hypothetical protein
MTVSVYAGIGARETPPEVLALMRDIGRHFAALGAVLRSGGSPGADAAFEEGCGDGPKEIYLPHPGFNGNSSPLALDAAWFARIAAHAAWRALREALARESPPVDLDALPLEARLRYARDVPQALGRDLTSPADLVICWTPPAGPPEGTRVALYVARQYGVPVANLNDGDERARWARLVSERSR